MDYKQFYRELGKLLYAVAKADGSVQKEEARALRELVAKEIAPAVRQSDGSGMNLAYYTDFEFDTLVRENATGSSALRSFMDFMHKNPEHFDLGLRQLCVTAIEKVALANRRSQEAMVEALRAQILQHRTVPDKVA